MDKLIESFRRKISLTNPSTLRDQEGTYLWESRLLGIRGARGVGKTTLLLQHIKKHFGANLHKALYVSLDNLYFADHSLLDLADTFYKQGGTHLFLDEVHKYPDWSLALKNIYDDFPDLHVVFTGSSLLEILNAQADISRRAVVYDLPGLSYREFLNLKLGLSLPPYTLEHLLQHHQDVAAGLVENLRPLEYFRTYLEGGYYPFFLEGEAAYSFKLEEVVLMILDVELPSLRKVEVATLPKLKKLLSVIAESAPFIPNITKLSDRTGINRQTLMAYLGYLEEARILRNLYRESRGMGALQKPDKIYLENTNLMKVLGANFQDPGNMRETFLANQLSHNYQINFTDQGDFLVNRRYTLEVGGKSKTQKQLQGIKDGFVVADGLEIGSGTKIPLWLFGFLY